MVNKTSFYCFLDKFRTFLISFLLVIFGVFCVKNLTYGAEISDVKIGNFTYSLDEGTQTATVKKCDPGFWDKLFGSITIPEEVKYENKKYFVKNIGEKFLFGNKTIKKVTGNSIEKISRDAFLGCDDHFGNCSPLQKISFPKATYIGDRAFYYCCDLSDIHIPTAIHIGYAAFFYWISLYNTNLPDVQQIGGHAFYDCRGLKNIILPNANQIGEFAIANCHNLNSLYLPNASQIGVGAFCRCLILKNIILPQVTKIQEATFNECKNLENIILPKVKYIHSKSWLEVFGECNSLKSIEAPNLESCSENIFEGLPYGIKVTFKVPASMRNFGLEKFENSDKAKIIYTDWGEKIENNGIINYVDESGKTSAEITGNEIIWLKETSDGTSAWYAIDNSSGTFKTGSKFWVKWLSPEVDSKEFHRYYDKLDDERKKKVKDNKLWVFLTGVTDPDGNEYKNWDGIINYYIQLGDDWDENNIEAVFISEGNDSIVECKKDETMASPEGTAKFAKLSLKHFSPYVIFEKTDTGKNLTPTGLVEKTAVLNFMFTASLLSIAVLSRKLNFFN